MNPTSAHSSHRWPVALGVWKLVSLCSGSFPKSHEFQEAAQFSFAFSESRQGTMFQVAQSLIKDIYLTDRVPQKLIWAFSLCVRTAEKNTNLGGSSTSPISNLPAPDQLPSMGCPNLKINSAVPGRSWLPEPPLTCCIPSSTRDTAESCHPPVGVGPGPKETPAGAGLAAQLWLHALCCCKGGVAGQCCLLTFPVSGLSLWELGQLAESQLLLGFYSYQGWTEQQEAGDSCQGFCSLCAQQGLKVEILACLGTRFQATAQNIWEIIWVILEWGAPVRKNGYKVKEETKREGAVNVKGYIRSL